MKHIISCLVFFSTIVLVCSAQGEGNQATPLSFSSPEEEIHPCISADGSMLYFSRKGNVKNIDNTEDIWVSYRTVSGSWSKPIHIGSPVNSLRSERVAGLVVSNKQLFLYRVEDATLYRSEREGRMWKAPTAQYIEEWPLSAQATGLQVSFDGNILMLSLRDQQGQEDLYVSFRHSDNEWSPPVFCGNNINTSYRESAPFLAADNKTLYFSTDRPGGEGGMDIYYSIRLDDSWKKWTRPESLGSVTNTSEDEQYPTLPARGDRLVFSRKGNLYEAYLPKRYQPEPVAMVKGQVQHQSNNHRVPSASILVHKDQLNDTGRLETNGDGSYQIIIPQGTSIHLMADVEGYFPISEPVYNGGQSLEQLDQEETPLMASLQKSAAYRKRDEEIKNLQLHLKVLDEEMLEIQRVRKEYLAKMKKEERPVLDRSHLSDPELDALKHRFDQHQHAAKSSNVEQDTLPIDYNQAEMSRQDVEDMKTRYMRFYENERKAREEIELEKNGEQFLWQEARPSFEEVEAEVISELEAEVEKSLSNELVPEVAKEVEAELSPLERTYVAFEPEALKSELGKGLREKKSAQWTAKGRASEAEWERDLKQDLRKKLEEPVKSELRTELEAEVKQRLKTDISYLAKQKARKKVEQQLQQKLQEQMAAEASVRNGAQAKQDVVKPLIPLPNLEGGHNSGSYQEIEKNLLLVPAEVGMHVELNTVSFEPNSKLLQPSAYPELNRVLEFLQKNETLVVEFGVHTGGQLSHSTAQRLSNERAHEISRFLIGNGINPERLVVRGYGKSLPIADNQTKKGQMRNQRVEMSVVGKL
jgi:outer membrane protein OmpA-like peptidoglycan-associated protein